MRNKEFIVLHKLAASTDIRLGLESPGIEKVVHHPDLFLDLKDFLSLVGKVLRHGRQAVGGHNRKPRDIVVRRIGADERNIGAVQGRDNLRLYGITVRYQQLLCQKSAGRMGNGIVHVHDVQVEVAGHIGHLRRQGQRVGWILEQRVGRHIDRVVHQVAIE